MDEAGLIQCKAFGVECQANGGVMREYQARMAIALGYQAWDDLPMAVKDQAVKAFVAGRRDSSPVVPVS